MGNILMPHKKELNVDLQAFYQVVKVRPPEAVDKALQEFYLCVMVGSLAKTSTMSAGIRAGTRSF